MSMDGGGGGGEVEPTEAERALAETSAKDWNDFVTMYSPVEDEYIKRISSKSAIDKGRSQQLGAAASDAVAALDVSGARTSKLKAAGMPGNSAAMLQQTMSDASNYRKGLFAAAPATEAALTQRELGGKLKIVALERGLQAASRVALGDSARLATHEAINNSQLQSQSRASLLDGVFTAAGSAAAPYIYKKMSAAS